MAGRGVDRLGMTRGRSIAAAIVWRAQMRAALDHLAWNLDVGLAGIVACGLSAAARIFRDAAGLRRVRVVLVRVPVSGPFPDIADHVVNAVTVRRECRHGRGALKTIGVQILPRKLALPGVGLVLAAGREFVA